MTTRKITRRLVAGVVMLLGFVASIAMPSPASAYTGGSPTQLRGTYFVSGQGTICEYSGTTVGVNESTGAVQFTSNAVPTVRTSGVCSINYTPSASNVTIEWATSFRATPGSGSWVNSPGCSMTSTLATTPEVAGTGECVTLWDRDWEVAQWVKITVYWPVSAEILYSYVQHVQY